MGRRQRNGRQRSVGAQQIHSYSYPQILLSLSLTQMDLQFQLSCSHVKIFFVPNAELCPKDEVGGYCSNRKCWVASDDANKHLNLFFLLLTVKSKTYQFTTFPPSLSCLHSPEWGRSRSRHSCSPSSPSFSSSTGTLRGRGPWYQMIALSTKFKEGKPCICWSR